MEEVALAASTIALAGGGVAGAILATVVALRRDGDRRRLVPVAGSAVVLLCFASGAVAPVATWAERLSVLFFVAFPLAAATFPDGRFVPGWSRWVVLAAAAVVAADLILGGAPSSSAFWWIVPDLLGLLSVAFLAHRYRRSRSTPEREGLRWVLLGTCVTVSCFMVLLATTGSIGEGGPAAVVAANLAGLPMLLGVVIGMARPRIGNVDAAWRAVLVVLLAGWTLAGVYAAVGLSGSAPLAAAIAIALAWPVVTAAMRAATWLVFRSRLDPAAAVARLGAELDADDERPVAQRVVDAAAEATGSPAVALRPADPRDVTAAARHGGEPGAAAERFAVDRRGERLATLVVAPRHGESALGRRDRAALAAIAQHAAPALHGARALAEATAAQAALVSAREEERRALRRELHDDLGPALSGLALTAAAISLRSRGEAPALADAADELRTDIADAVERARAISHGLRPAVLDDQGLAAALRDRLGPDVDLRVALDGPPLPAAVDLAALRIVQEAVTNVRRHARATTCRVRLTRDAAELRIEVEDDGIGIPGPVVTGLGLRSIRERSAELGGAARVERGPLGGTRIRVRLPVPA